MLSGAKNYAAADRSDPFAFDRAMAHIEQGIVGVLQDGTDAMYSADAFSEERIAADGKPFTITVYRNVQRP